SPVRAGLFRKVGDAAHAQVGTRPTWIETIAQGGSHPFVKPATPASPPIDLVSTTRSRPRVGSKPTLRPLPHIAHDIMKAKGSFGEFSTLATLVGLPAG